MRWTFTRPDGTEATIEAGRVWVEWTEPGCILHREEATGLRPAGSPAPADIERSVREVLGSRTSIGRAEALGRLQALLGGT